MYPEKVNQSTAVMERACRFLEYIVREEFVDELGHTEMHIMKERVFDLGVAFGLQKNSIYAEAIGRKLQQLKVGFIS